MVGTGVTVGFGVAVGIGVGVMVGVGSGVAVGVGSGVAVGSGVMVGVGTGVAVGSGVAVEAGMAVPVGPGEVVAVEEGAFGGCEHPAIEKMIVIQRITGRIRPGKKILCFFIKGISISFVLIMYIVNDIVGKHNMGVSLFDVFCLCTNDKSEIFVFYIKMCLKGRKKIADKILAKMERKKLSAWMRL